MGERQTITRATCLETVRPERMAAIIIVFSYSSAKAPNK